MYTENTREFKDMYFIYCSELNELSKSGFDKWCTWVLWASNLGEAAM